MYPAFSPEEELRDEDFCRLIAAGVDARTAYEVRHREELLRQADALCGGACGGAGGAQHRQRRTARAREPGRQQLRFAAGSA